MSPLRPFRRAALVAAVLAAAGAGTAATATATRTPSDAELALSGVPRLVGRGQPFVVNVSGSVNDVFLGPGGSGASVLVTAVQDEHVPKGTCAADDGDYRGVVLLARDIATEHFSFTARTRIRSDLDDAHGQRHPFRVCVLVFPNGLRKGQNATQATEYDSAAARTQVTAHRVSRLPERVTGRVLAADGTGLAGVRVRADTGEATYTGGSGRYDLLVRRGRRTLTPALAGTTFAPTSRALGVPASRAVDFTATGG